VNVLAWETVDEIEAVLAWFERQIPGWRRPVAHGVTLVRGGAPGTVRFPVVNVAGHDLPAVVMALVTGRVAETGTFPVSCAQLDRAIEMLAPAEAAKMFRHPNIAAWRAMRDRLRSDPAGKVFAVFIADFDDPSSGPCDDALRAQIAAGAHLDYPDA
jgi:hypothetical protein